MKKQLFLFLFLISLNGFSQVFWAKRATSFANTRGVSDISIADANNVWMQAYDGVTPTNVIREYARSTDGGDTWTNGNIGIPSTSTICSFKATSGLNCYVGANPDGLFKTTDGGTNWVNKTVGLFTDSTSFFDFGAFINDQVGVVVGDPAGGYMEIYRTTDGGSTWVRIPSSSFSLPIISGEYAFTNSYSQFGNAIYFFTNKHRTYRSLDAGLTWTVLDNPFLTTSSDTSPGGKLCLKNELEGIYYGPYTSYTYWKTTDGGATFSDLSAVAAGVLRDADLSFVQGTLDSYVSIGDDVDAALRGTSYSCDGGVNWEDINLLGDISNVNASSAITFFSPTLGFASGFNTSSSVGGIFKYVGVGFNSIAIAGTLTGNQDLCGQITTTTFVSDGTSGGDWSTSDATIATVSATGVVTAVAPGTATITYNVTVVSGSFCPITPATRTVTVCNLANTQFSSDKKFTISPNPTTGRFTLAGANITQVQVIDVLGKVIINNNYTSLSSIDINLENTNSGIYMVKITNDAGNTSVMKVIKQ